MARPSLAELKAMLAAEKADALAAQSSSRLSKERSDAMDYYLGDMIRAMPAQEGRSSAVSTDVADTIEGLMPSLMEIFAGSDEVVRFEPVGPEDVAAAEQETEYVNHVFMQKNPGFLVLYGFIKDALLSKVGIVKVWWDAGEREERETFLDQPLDAVAALIEQNPDVEVTALTEHDGLHDVEITTRTRYGCARAEGVPPEEFGISRHARSIADASYFFHEVRRAESTLIADGYDARQVKALPGFVGSDNVEQQARDTVEENAGRSGDDGANTAARLIRVTEHYIRTDLEDDGNWALWKITTGGDGDVLLKDGEPDIERLDVAPFAAMTPVIVTHRFFGRSIADLVMDIQRIKTALLRGALDNLYLHNNPRVEVAETHASETTLDDLLVSRPGGIVRTKQPGGVQWQVVPDITGTVYPALEYFDATREWRTGVTRQGQGIDANALQNQSATAVNQAYTASQARMKLIARIFAETGVRDLFSLLHATIRRNGSQAATVRLRNRWVAVDPREWKRRDDMTVNVGLGSGGKSERLAHLMALINLQKEAVAAGLTNLVNPQNLYNSAREMVKLLDLKSVEQFFTDPRSVPPAPPQPDPKLVELQARNEIEKQKSERDYALEQQRLQKQAEIEGLQAQADIATQREKTQAEIARDDRKHALEMERLQFDFAADRERHAMDMEKSRAAIEAARAQAATKVAVADHAAGLRERQAAEGAEP